jgi:hypothetical protein
MGITRTWNGHTIDLRMQLARKYLWLATETIAKVDSVEVGRSGGFSWKEKINAQFVSDGRPHVLSLEQFPDALAMLDGSVRYNLRIDGELISHGRLGLQLTEPAGDDRSGGKAESLRVPNRWHPVTTFQVTLLGGVVGGLLLAAPLGMVAFAWLTDISGVVSVLAYPAGVAVGVAVVQRGLGQPAAILISVWAVLIGALASLCIVIALPPLAEQENLPGLVSIADPPPILAALSAGLYTWMRRRVA